ncbi:prepilin-type N-terminal cleavage/methylation domain-containing protein [Clostridium taeniosporum]|uniref:Prepilin-type cleavage/methylation domain-containing protein n=1 Tax=Clostridium taeniosporum TaxID=394958 RepID=A0A1D7XKP4_9CLOT|nr:prepilin-type N-terminal cleavage/methylation domain-containing protein [Clostridium taeniosporum]AOR23925.1 prepilin-type cleavage/methylation domain-containing protein [Clostridium taeniosporum]
MKHKGFTLIEVIASLSIILIIFSLTASVKDINSVISNKIEWESVLYDVENLFTYSKAYCKKNKINGEIQVDNIRNKIIFSPNDRKRIKQVILPNWMKIFTKNECMQVKSNGHINQGKTIGFKDYKNNMYEITVLPGIDYININEVCRRKDF